MITLSHIQSNAERKDNAEIHSNSGSCLDGFLLSTTYSVIFVPADIAVTQAEYMDFDDQFGMTD